MAQTLMRSKGQIRTGRGRGNGASYRPWNLSPKHQLGLSCCKIKQKDMGQSSTQLIPCNSLYIHMYSFFFQKLPFIIFCIFRSAHSKTNDYCLLDTQGNGGITYANYCNDQRTVSTEISEGMMKEALADTSKSHQVDDHARQTEVHHYVNEREGDKVMERVLEQQAILVGQFQAEEDAQIECEDKYNENKTTLVKYKLGNRYCMAEKISQFKKEVVDRTPDYSEEEKLRNVYISNSEEPNLKVVPVQRIRLGAKKHAV